MKEDICQTNAAININRQKQQIKPGKLTHSCPNLTRKNKTIYKNPKLKMNIDEAEEQKVKELRLYIDPPEIAAAGMEKQKMAASFPA